MAYVFNLFHMVTAVYNVGKCFYVKNVQHFKYEGGVKSFASSWIKNEE
jgi:hypothetical protein